MKKYLIVVVLTALVFGCQKKTDVVVEPQSVEVVFGAVEVNPSDGLKSTDDWICPTDGNGDLIEPAYAEITIDGTVYSPSVYRMDGKLYTQAIKMEMPGSTPRSCTVTSFLLRSDSDEIIMATPSTGADYGEYVSQGVPFTFQVNSFEKTEVPAEVLCFLPESYEAFGFDWFQVTEIVLRESCFFGDICLKHPEDYLSSLYGTHQPPVGECKVDMSAIFKIHAYVGDTTVDENELPNSPFTNATDAANYGVGSPLCVQYPDNLRTEGEVFTFNLYILVKSGDDFKYKLFATFTATDDGPLKDTEGNVVPDINADGVTEFVLGSCNYSETDVQFAPYQNLPETCQLKMLSPYAPGAVSGDYMDAKITGISGTGYDLVNGTYGAYCFDRKTNIAINWLYNMDVFSSLNPQLLPAYLRNESWDQLNWMINHLDDYPVDWSDIQQVVWKIENSSWSGAPYDGCSAITADGLQLYNDAVAYGNGYVPLPGGWAAVCFVPTGTPPDQENPLVQTVFVAVDP